MAIHTKTFTFASNAEDWVATPESPMTMGHATGLLFAELAVGANDTLGYWRWSGDFASLDLPVNDGINSIRVSFDYNLTLLNRGIAGSTSFNIDTDNYLAVLRQTADVTNGTRTSSFETVTYNYTDEIQLEVPIRLETGSGNPAGNRFVRVELLEIRVEIDYDAILGVLEVSSNLTNEAQSLSGEIFLPFTAEVEANLTNTGQSFNSQLRMIVPPLVLAGNVYVWELPDNKPDGVVEGSEGLELSTGREYYYFDEKWNR